MFRTRLATVAAVAALVSCGDPRNDPRPEPRTPGAKTATATATATATVTASAADTAKPASKVGEQAASAIEGTTLNERERAAVAQQLDLLMAPCADTPVSLAQCVVEKRECKTCKPAAELVARLVRAAVPATDLVEFYKMRFDPENVKTIEIGKAPFKGPEDAPVTIVEWADFQCPACRDSRHAMNLALERFPGQVRVVYKYYKITGHDRALEAAYAAEAAHKQGKFWEMHDKIFENPEALSRSDLRKYARELDLDLEKFKKDFDAEETKKLVEADIKQADELGLDATPLFYVNGRVYSMNPFSPEFEHWIELELQERGVEPAKPTAKYAEIRKELGLDKRAAGDPLAPGSAEPATSAAPTSSASAGPAESASAGPAGSASAGPPKKKAAPPTPPNPEPPPP